MTVSKIAHYDLLQAPLAIDERYMLLPIELGFDWSTCFDGVDTGEWYLVVFRSRHRQDADKDFLSWLDSKATEGAQQTPGFLYYFTGVPLATGECLSFCLWNSRQAAIKAASHVFHREAMDLGLMNYEYYCLERYIIRKQYGELTFIPVEGINR